MKNIYIVLNQHENNKNFAFVEVMHTGQNIKPILERYKNADIWHLCETRKQADDLAQFWNRCYKNNGTYLFSKVG